MVGVRSVTVISFVRRHRWSEVNNLLLYILHKYFFQNCYKRLFNSESNFNMLRLAMCFQTASTEL